MVTLCYFVLLCYFVTLFRYLFVVCSLHAQVAAAGDLGVGAQVGIETKASKSLKVVHHILDSIAETKRRLSTRVGFNLHHPLPWGGGRRRRRRPAVGVAADWRRWWRR